MTRLPTVAVVLAGGTGTRVGHSLPKQLIEIAGRPMIEHSIAAFQASPLIDEIIVLMTPGHLDVVRSIVRDGGFDKVSAVTAGGPTRSGSTRLAIDLLGDDDRHVLLHDAARPLVTQRIIADVVEALQSYDAVTTAVPSSDTILQVGAGAPTVVDQVLPRDALRRVQTPQAFRLSVIRRAHAAAAADPAFVATDDASVVLHALPEVPIAVVAGHERNIKVTEPVDVLLADSLLRHGTDDPGTP